MNWGYLYLNQFYLKYLKIEIEKILIYSLKMETALAQLKKFLEFQIKTYQKANYIEIEFGKKISDEIFKTIYQDNDEIEFTKLIKPFRNYKLSYSQGKEYQLQNKVLKTFNNKYNQIIKRESLESEVISFPEYDVKVNNVNRQTMEEFPLQKDYFEEREFEEVNIHLNPESLDQLLIFQKLGDYHLLKMELLLDVNLPYHCLDNLVVAVRKILETLQEKNFQIT